MRDGTTAWVDWEREDELEEAGTRLLRAAGALGRNGVRSPRSVAEARRGCVPWDDWVETRLHDAGGVDVRHLLEALGRLAQLTAEQQIVLELHVDDYSYRDIARLLRVTLWRVRVLLAEALRRCRRCAEGPPATPRSLFWEEVRDKRASIYRPPLRWRLAGRRLRWAGNDSRQSREPEEHSQHFRTPGGGPASEGATDFGTTKGPNR